MANSAIVTDTNDSRSGLTVYKIDWLSDDADGSISLPFQMRAGRLIQAKFFPDAGATQPSAAYDLTITDADGADILEGGGANLSQTAATWNNGAAQVFLNGGVYTLVVANAGNAKGGIVWLYIQ